MKSPYEANEMIIEGLMVTSPHVVEGASAPGDELSRVNIAPMGPIVGPEMARFVFRPFRSSTTYQNLKATGQGVFHVTDDALLIARAALGRVVARDHAKPQAAEAGHDAVVRPAERVRGFVLTSACRWFELEVVSIDDRQERTTIEARTIHTGRLRDFAGFNRARHAVIEAAILATRVHLTGKASVLEELDRLMVAVEKTGSDAEHLAMMEIRAAIEGR